MKILIHCGSLLLACMAMTFGLSIDASRASAAQTRTAQERPDLAAIDAYVSKQMRDLGIPGVALGIVRGNRIVHLRGFGVADETGRPVTALTGMLTDWDKQEGLEATVRSLWTVELGQAVGAGFQYSNVSYSIAGPIVEAASGQP